MVGLKKVKKYRVSNEELFNELRDRLSGFIFTRKDETGFYIKLPKMDLVDNLVSMGLLIEV